MFRGLLQGAIFENSWLGLVLTSSLFSFMHEPYDVPSFFLLSTWELVAGLCLQKEPKFVGFYSSPHVLQQFATFNLFLKIMKR